MHSLYSRQQLMNLVIYLGFCMILKKKPRNVVKPKKKIVAQVLWTMLSIRILGQIVLYKIFSLAGIEILGTVKRNKEFYGTIYFLTINVFSTIYIFIYNTCLNMSYQKIKIFCALEYIEVKSIIYLR